MSKFNLDIEKVIPGVEKEIAKKGYVYPDAEYVTNIPEEYKMFDMEIADMTMDELLNKLSIFTSLLASASWDEATYLAKVAGLQRELDIVKADVFINTTGDKVRDREKQRDSDARVVKLQEELTIADVYLRKFSALRASYEKFTFLYSRAVTVQTKEKELQ